jgi:hypothetical protein
MAAEWLLMAKTVDSPSDQAFLLALAFRLYVRNLAENSAVDPRDESEGMRAGTRHRN